ncbi:MAG: hypothetical protein Q4P72_04670, partial [Eubacteriales bacterium]|nr:hypothetical protein [Eubacteriales bacterium]
MDRNKQRIWMALACLGMLLLSSCKIAPAESDPSSTSSSSELSNSGESSSASSKSEAVQQTALNKESSQSAETEGTSREDGDLLSLILPSAQHASIDERVTLDGRNSLFDPYRVTISLDEVESGRAAEDFLESEGIDAPALDRRYEYVIALMTIKVDEVYDESKQAKIQTFDFELLDSDSHPYPPILNVSDKRFGIDG